MLPSYVPHIKDTRPYLQTKYIVDASKSNAVETKSTLLDVQIASAEKLLQELQEFKRIKTLKH